MSGLFFIVCSECENEMELDYTDNDNNKAYYSCEECNLEIQIIATVTVEAGYLNHE